MTERQRRIVTQKNLRFFVAADDGGIDAVFVSSEIAFRLDAALVERDDRESILAPLVQPVTDGIVVLEKQLTHGASWTRRRVGRRAKRVVVRYTLERALQPKNTRGIIHERVSPQFLQDD